MNTPNPILSKSRLFIVLKLLAFLPCAMVLPAVAQLQWSSYDTSGNLVTANVATGGDLASGGTVTFTIPANTQLAFATKSFTPFSVAAGNARKLVSFNVSVSAGFGGVAQRTMGWGLYNSAGTAGFADDVGYFGLWNGAGPYIETYDHPAGTVNLLSGTQLGQGTVNTGTPSNGVTYTNQIQLVMNAAATGISLGTSSSTLANAGLAMNGVNVTHRVYTNPVNGPLGGATSFDEFVFMFNNTTASPVTVTLSAVSLGKSLTWDASGANPTAPTDGAGNWSSTNANWSSGSSDSVWSPGYSAVIGANNGASGTLSITEPAGVTVSNVTFNTNYTVSGSALTLVGTPTITVASGSTATNTEIISGTGFVKAGGGVLRLAGSVANNYSGQVTVNAGTLTAASGNNSITIASDLLVNPNGTFLYSQNSMIDPTKTLIVNGGLVTNVTASTVLTVSKLVLDNNGLIADSTGNSYANATNYDLRSGNIFSSRYRIGGMNTFKSTAGTVIITNRPNASATDGHIVTMNGGTLVFDKYTLNSARLLPNGGLTLGGGFLMFTNGNPLINPTTENPGSGNTTIIPGASSVLTTNQAPSTGGSITFGGFFRKTGGTLDFFKNAAGSSTTTNVNVNGIQGGWATWNKSDWLIGTTLAPYTAYTVTTLPSGWVAANNVSLSGNPSANADDVTINSLRLTAASTVTINATKTLTLASGGLLVTGSGATTITGGNLQAGVATGDLIFHQYSSADLTIASDLADNSASSLTKSGPGKLILTGVNNLTGTNYLNGGTVEVSDLARLAAGPLVMNACTLRYTGSSATESRAVTFNGLGGTFDVTPGTTLTLANTLRGSGAAIGDLGGLTKLGAGTLVLSSTNYFNGATVVSNGVLAINGTNAYDKATFAAGNVAVYGGVLGGNGTISGPVFVKNGGTISPGTSPGTLTLATNLTLEGGSTSLFEVTNGALGDLLVVQGNLVIGANSTLAISVLGAALEATTNTLITYSGTKSGSFNPTVVVAGGALNSSVSIDESTPGQIKLVASPQVVIISQPADLTVSTNTPATFNVGVTGTAPLSYQWYRYADINGNSPVPQADATNATFTIASAQSSDSGFYGVIVTNNYNSAASRIASLIVGDVLPVLSGPTNQTVIAGSNVTFSTKVTLANPYPGLQWQTNGVDVTGATSTNLTLTGVPFAYDGMLVSVIATNNAGLVTNSAILTVIVTPVITPQPNSLIVNVGDTAVFTSGATGVPTPALQWYKNGTVIPGQTGNTLTISSAQGSDIANYRLVATNTAGSVTSSVVTLTVNSTSLATTALAPANGATAICYDTPLYVTFNGAISIVNSGRIRIYNSTNSSTPVDIIDMSSNTVVVSGGIGLVNNIQPHSLFSGDAQVINYFPVIISGTTAAIYPHLGVMTSNQTYYVTMDNGIVKDAAGAYFAGISDTNAWRFTTKPVGPVNSTNLVVAADGSGDFVTVQGAVDSVTPGNTNYTVVNIRDGNYVEIVDISGKNNLTFRGQSRLGTMVGYPNNNNLTGTTAARMAFKVNSSDIKLENLTLTNGTPQGGSQAETLLIYNNGLRCVVNNCDIVSRQDTILINASTSQGYFNNCRVVGNFDYVWGSGVGYFNNCVFHTITNTLSGSYNLTAARTLTSGTLSVTTPWVNPNGTTYSAYGFTFVSCVLEADPGVTGITLAGSNGTAGGQDDFINCCIDTNAYVTPTTTLSNTYVFWQNGNKEITCTYPIAFANVQTIGVTNNDPRLLAATNVTTWFNGWLPQLAPNILAQPTNLIVNANQTATFTVVATGIADPSYQWLKNGTNLVGQTSATLTINNANGYDIGAYSVIVSNAAGVVTSSAASLSVNAPTVGPDLAATTVLGNGNVQFAISGPAGSTGFTYRVWATTNLALTPVTSTWTLLTNDVFGTGPTVFTDPDASALPQRFYIITVP